MRCAENAATGKRGKLPCTNSFVAPPPRRSASRYARSYRAAARARWATAALPARRPASSCRRSVRGRSSTTRPKGKTFASSCTRAASSHPWSLALLPSGDMLVTERGGQLRIVRDGTLDPQPIAGVPEVRVAGLVGSVRRRAASAVCDESLRLFELQQAGRRAAERPRCRARRLERPRADRRARHLRDDGLEQRVAARVRPRRQALRQHVRQRRRRHGRAESHEPRRQSAAAE